MQGQLLSEPERNNAADPLYSGAGVGDIITDLDLRRRAMDPVITAVLAAITAGAAKGATEIVKNTIVGSYEALKGLLKKKAGSGSEVIEAVSMLENKPESAARRQMVCEELSAIEAARDPDLLSAAQALLDQIRSQPGGERHIQIAQGVGIAQADRGSTATVNISDRKDG